MNREQMIAHLVLGGWVPLDSRPFWVGLWHESPKLVYQLLDPDPWRGPDKRGALVTTNMRHDEIAKFPQTWDAIEDDILFAMAEDISAWGPP